MKIKRGINKRNRTKNYKIYQNFFDQTTAGGVSPSLPPSHPPTQSDFNFNVFIF